MIGCPGSVRYLRQVSQPRVAIIDDSAEIRDLLTEILSAGGYDVIRFDGEGEDLIPRLAAALPDLVILDLLLRSPSSNLSGWDLFRLVRHHQELHGVPILVCSADVQALRARQDDFAADPQVRALEKPFTVDDLETAVMGLVAAQALPLWDDEADLVLVADRDSNLVHASSAAVERLGIPLAELRRLRVADIVAYGREWTDREWKRYLDDRRWEGAVTLRARDGRELAARGRADIVEGGSGIWHVSRLILEGE